MRRSAVLWGLPCSDKSKAFDGYTLVAPLQTNVTYLMDMDGNIINEWTCDTTHSL